MKNKMYYYDDRYYTIEEIYEKYEKLVDEQKKGFRDALAHFTLAGILVNCNYDERYINIIVELSRLETAFVDLYGAYCGNISLALRGQYRKKLRKLINLTGKVACNEDTRINRFKNGEWLLNNLVCLTIGSSFEKDSIGDLSLIDCDSFSDDECRAISDNFVRDMRDEEIIFYGRNKYYTKK